MPMDTNIRERAIVEDGVETATDVVASALDLYNRGFSVIPVKPCSKCPEGRNWQAQRLDAVQIGERFRKDENIGVLLGEPSGWLVDVDIDGDVALKLADRFLPVTGMVWGRSSRPRSHRIYRTTDYVGYHEWTDCEGRRVIELRSTGQMTIAPGSVHPSGEAVRFDEDGEATMISPAELLRALDALANACGCTQNTQNTQTQKTQGRVGGKGSTPQDHAHSTHEQKLDIDNYLHERENEMAKVANLCKVTNPAERHSQLLRLVRGWAIDLQLRDYIKQDDRGALPPALRRRFEAMWFEPNREKSPHRSLADNWAEFRAAWSRVRFSLDADLGAEAFARAHDREVPGSIRELYPDDPARQILLAAFRELTIECGEIVFLSSRQIARGLEHELLAKGHNTFDARTRAANRILNSLDADEPRPIEIVTRGKPGGKKAHEVRYRLPLDE